MGEFKGGVKKNIYTIQGCIYTYAKVLTLECCRKNLMNQPIAIYTIDKLNKLIYITQQAWPQLESEFCKFTNGWNLYVYGQEKNCVELQLTFVVSGIFVIKYWFKRNNSNTIELN